MSSKEEQNHQQNDQENTVDLLTYITKQQELQISELKKVATTAIDTSKSVQHSLDEVLVNQKEFKNNQKAVNKRISAMEWTVKKHSDTMKSIEEDQVELSTNLTTIKETITQIKWIGYGALGMYGLQLFGIQDIVKSIF